MSKRISCVSCELWAEFSEVLPAGAVRQDGVTSSAAMRVGGAITRSVLGCLLAAAVTPGQGQPDGGRREGAPRQTLRIGAVIPRSSFVRGYWRSLVIPINDMNRRMTFPEKYVLSTASVTLGMMKDESSPMSESTRRDSAAN